MKRAEELLCERERQLRTLLGNLPGVAYRCRYAPGFPFEFVSDGIVELGIVGRRFVPR